MTGKAVFSAKEIQIGQAYEVVISGRLRSVRIDARESPGVWRGTNLSTQCEVYVALADLIRLSSPRPPCAEWARAAAGDRS